MFAVGIAWTSIFELPEAPPKRERTRKFGASAVVIKVKPEPVSVKVAEPETEAPEIVSYAGKSHWGRVTFTHTNHTEDYGFDCGECHHLQMEGGYNKCSIESSRPRGRKRDQPPAGDVMSRGDRRDFTYCPKNRVEMVRIYSKPRLTSFSSFLNSSEFSYSLIAF